LSNPLPTCFYLAIGRVDPYEPRVAALDYLADEVPEDTIDVPAGCFMEDSVRSLAEHLNDHGIRPQRGPNKAKHNRPAALIFTGDVIKDILTNRSYRGKVVVDGELVEGNHPPLVDEATWEACAQARAHNQRRTSKAWTRHSYPLTPLLYCGLCGGRMHGEASKKGNRVDLYYACNNARRNRSAVAPRAASCAARFLAAGAILAAFGRS
jgi:Recombinase/Recombinase zinc beta ribbon domain